MATSPTDRSVKDEEEKVRTEEIDPAKTSDEEDEVRTEENEERTQEEEVRTEEVDPAKTTEEEDEVKTEEADTSKTAEQEDEVKTEEVDPVKTTQEAEEKEEARTEEEDKNKEEANESLLDPARTPSIEDEESDQQTENQNRQEYPITVRRSDHQTIEHGSTSAARDPAGDQMSQAMVPHLGPRWLVVDHFYTDGLGLYGALWRFRTTTPLNPNENTYLPHQLGMIELPGQPGLVSVCYHQSFGVLQQDRLVPHEAPPQTMMQQNQFRSQAPMRPMLPQDQFVVYLGQVPVRPMMYYLEQNQIVPNVGQQPPPSPPVTCTQDQTAHSLRQFDAPLMQPPVMLYTPPPIVNAVPVSTSPMMMNYNAAAAARAEEVNQQRQSQAQHSRQSSHGSNDGQDEPQG